MLPLIPPVGKENPGWKKPATPSTVGGFAEAPTLTWPHEDFRRLWGLTTRNLAVREKGGELATASTGILTEFTFVVPSSKPNQQLCSPAEPSQG